MEQVANGVRGARIKRARLMTGVGGRAKGPTQNSNLLIFKWRVCSMISHLISHGMDFRDLPITADQMTGRAIFTYGPTDMPELEITVLDPDGDPVLLIFRADAIRQLSKLLRDIREICPAATDGH